jgi:molybdopterin synthase sulfur carrier subunit
MINVLFFAQIREVLKTDRIQLQQNFESVGELRKALQETDALWHEYLAVGRTLVAVNQTISSDNTPLSNNDEVAFFPPVTGG